MAPPGARWSFTARRPLTAQVPSSERSSGAPSHFTALLPPPPTPLLPPSPPAPELVPVVPPVASPEPHPRREAPRKARVRDRRMGRAYRGSGRGQDPISMGMGRAAREMRNHGGGG